VMSNDVHTYELETVVQLLAVKQRRQDFSI